MWALNPMTGVLLRRGGFGVIQTHTERRPCGKRGRNESDAAVSQGMPRMPATTRH